MGLLANISTFGDGAAEEDRAVLSYFMKTDAVDKIESGKSYVVIGRKGSGKTALVKYFSQNRHNYVSESPSLRDYPWNLHYLRRNLGASDMESYVSSRRYLIAVKANSVLLASKGVKLQTDSQIAARDFLNENYGGIRPNLRDILAPKRIKVTKRTFSPQIMGNSVGSIDIEDEKGGVSSNLDLLTDALLQNAKTISGQCGVSHVDIHFDELDQGLSSLDERHREMITGLVLATRSIRNSPYLDSVVRPVCYVRTDVWDELTFSDKNKISQSSSVTLEWDSSSLLEMINQRIKFTIGPNFSWENLDDGKLMRGSQTKWSHIISRTFLRPRDVIQFLNYSLVIALKNIPDSDSFCNEDIQSARAPYSRYLKQELDDEIGPHWARWIEALQAFSEIVTITFTKDKFIDVFNRRKSENSKFTAEEALKFLYGFSVVGYRRGIGSGGSGWAFQYTDPDVGWDNGTKQLKVHLGLKEFAKLREGRGAA